MKREELLYLENREIIYRFILKYPGVHLGKIQKELKISSGATRYHIDYLLKKNLITEKHDETYIRYYATSEIGKEEKEILHFLRKEASRNIILYLLVSSYGSQINISKAAEKDPKTITFHLKKLLEKNIIEATNYSNGFVSLNYKKTKFIELPSKKSREIIYTLKDPYLIYHTLSKHKGKFFDNNTTTVILKLFELYFRSDPPEKEESLESVEDRVINAFYEIFPPPYYA